MNRDDFDDLLKDIQNAGGDIIGSLEWGTSHERAERQAQKLRNLALEEFDRLTNKVQELTNMIGELVGEEELIDEPLRGADYTGIVSWVEKGSQSKDYGQT